MTSKATCLPEAESGFEQSEIGGGGERVRKGGVGFTCGFVEVT